VKLGVVIIIVKFYYHSTCYSQNFSKIIVRLAAQFGVGAPVHVIGYTIPYKNIGVGVCSRQACMRFGCLIVNRTTKRLCRQVQRFQRELDLLVSDNAFPLVVLCIPG